MLIKLSCFLTLKPIKAAKYLLRDKIVCCFNYSSVVFTAWKEKSIVFTSSKPYLITFVKLFTLILIVMR